MAKCVKTGSCLRFFRQIISFATNRFALTAAFPPQWGRTSREGHNASAGFAARAAADFVEGRFNQIGRAGLVQHRQ
jgi:hypothetical protein